MNLKYALIASLLAVSACSRPDLSTEPVGKDSVEKIAACIEADSCGIPTTAETIFDGERVRSLRLEYPEENMQLRYFVTDGKRFGVIIDHMRSPGQEYLILLEDRDLDGKVDLMSTSDPNGNMDVEQLTERSLSYPRAQTVYRGSLETLERRMASSTRRTSRN